MLAYAARSGQSEAEYLRALGVPLSPEIAGAALVELARTETPALAAGYLLTGGGLQPLP